jgi:hypothetical protein
VLDLGAGLDTRHARLNVPATVDWYDVDFPAVADVRERSIPPHPRGHVLGADVRDPGWLDAVPSDRPAVIVADGLMGFLSEDEMVSLWNRLISHFPSGELVFNAYTRLAVWVARHARSSKSVAGLIRFPGMDDPGNPKAGTPSCIWSARSYSAGNPKSPSFPWAGASSTGSSPTAPPCPGWQASFCTTASEDFAASDAPHLSRPACGPAGRAVPPERSRTSRTSAEVTTR